MEINIVTPHNIGDCVVVARGSSEIQLGIVQGVFIKKMDKDENLKVTYKVRFGCRQATYEINENEIIFNLKTLKGTAVYCGLPDNKYNEFSNYIDDLQQKFCNIINGVGMEESE